MVYRPKIDERLCFVLMPFEELHYEYFKGIIVPVAESLGLKARKADDIYGTAPIIEDIWQAIWSSKVVVADVSGKNANVNYELGLCHALGIPTVLITQKIEDVPFDYRHRRCIVYDTRRVNWQEKLRHDLELTLKAVLDAKDATEPLRWPYNTADLQYGKKPGLFVPTDEAREPILRGIAQGRDAIAKALGPHGTSVSMSHAFGDSTADRSGVVILSALETTTPLMQRGLEQLRAVAREVSSELGDGTKSAALLLAEMVASGFSAIQQGVVLRELIHDMDAAVEAVVNYIEKQSSPVTAEDVVAVAQTAALGDKIAASIVKEALSKAGPDGVVYMEDSPNLSTTLELHEGLYFSRGFITPKFITDEPTQMAVLEKPYIFIFDGSLASMYSVLPLMEQVVKAKGSLLVIAEDVGVEVLATFVENHRRGVLPSVAVRSPDGPMKQSLQEDIAVATGGVVIPGSNVALEGIFLGQLGRAERVEVSKDSTWLIGGHGKSDLIESRAAGIRQQISVAGSDYEREKLQERLAKLVGRIAAIRVGGASVVDRREKKYHVQSALHSAHAAIEGGVLPGGGNVLWRAQGAAFQHGKNPGSQVIADAIAVPLRTQLSNCRVSIGDILAEIDKTSDVSMGFNAEVRKITNLRKDGVLDATKIVVRTIQIAFSQARTVLQTGAWDVSEPAPRTVDAN